MYTVRLNMPFGVQFCVFWLRHSKITFSRLRFYAPGNDHFNWQPFFKFYFLSKMILVYWLVWILFYVKLKLFQNKIVSGVKILPWFPHETPACTSLFIYFFKVSYGLLMKANTVNSINERSICGPSGVCWLCPQRCQSRCNHTAALCKCLCGK